MRKTILNEEAAATLKRLESKDPGLKQLLKKAYGYVVFPSVGKAAAVIGGAYGHGVVFEKGKRIGYATIAQMTVGVQIGGDTFSEVVAFESKEAMDRFKRGKMAWAANASAVLVKAGAGGTADHEKGITALAYSRGGMMLELAIGGQKFKFRPLGGAAAKQGEEEDEDQSGEEQSSDDGEEDSGEEDAGGETALLGRAVGGVRDAASKAGDVAKQHPVLTTLAGAGLATGLALLIARSVRRSQRDRDDQSDGEAEDQYEDEGQEEDDEGESEEDDDRAEADNAEDDDAGEEEDSGEEEDTGRGRRKTMRRGRERARA